MTTAIRSSAPLNRLLEIMASYQRMVGEDGTFRVPQRTLAKLVWGEWAEQEDEMTRQVWEMVQILVCYGRVEIVPREKHQHRVTRYRCLSSQPLPLPAEDDE